MTLQNTPECFVSRLKQIPLQQRWAFAGVWAAGLFAHGYMLANKLPNHDDIFFFWSKGGSLPLGRWMLPLIGRLDGNFSSSWMLGLTALLFLSVSAMLTASLLRLKSPLFCFLAGAVLVAFPSVTALLGYMFMADSYMLAMLLMVLSAWLCTRACGPSSGRRRPALLRLAAAGCILFSLGLYQGLLGWAVALMMYTLLARCLEEDADVRRVFTDGLWDVGVLAAGVAGYIGVTQLIWAMTGTMGGYQGVDRMGQIELAALPRQVLDAYKLFFNILWDTSYGITTTGGLRVLLASCQWLAILLIGAAAARQFAAGKRLEAALAAVLGLLLPLGINIVCIMNAAYLHTLMIYPMCLIPLAFLSQCERWNAQKRPDAKPAQKRLHTLGRWTCVLLAALLVGRYARLSNEVYLQMQINHTRRLCYWTTVVSQIKSLPEYDQWLPVVIIKNDSDWDHSTPFTWKDIETMWDVVGVRMPIHVYSDQDFLNLYAGFSTEFLDPADYIDLPEVQQMPHYPADGSICRVVRDDVAAIVVKF